VALTRAEHDATTDREAHDRKILQKNKIIGELESQLELTRVKLSRTQEQYNKFRHDASSDTKTLSESRKRLKETIDRLNEELSVLRDSNSELVAENDALKLLDEKTRVSTAAEIEKTKQNAEGERRKSQKKLIPRWRRRSF
jgi:hypothetical protein